MPFSLEVITMGGSGAEYTPKTLHLTSEDIKRRLRESGSDAYLFDVEYEKLKKEEERLQAEYEREREKYLKITEQLRQEMLNGTASDADMARYMSALTDKGVQLQQQQQKMQDSINQLADQRADVENQMNELRKKAFSGSTNAYQSADKNTAYNGFKIDSNKSSYANAKIVEMTPQEYLRRVAFGFKNNSLESLVNSASPATVEKYMRQMLRGTKFNSPSLNYSRGSSVGMERVMAAMMNGYQRIPVMVIE